MKTRRKLRWLIVMVIALTGLLPTARAFYAPAEQRWLNRDPIQEQGGMNLYQFAGNEPIQLVDAFGETAIPWPGTFPVSIPRINPATAVLAAAAAAVGIVCTAIKSHHEWCDELWENARRRCAELLSQRYPSRRQTGGHTNIEDCAKGFVPEDCGGNAIDPGPGPRPGRRY